MVLLPQALQALHPYMKDAQPGIGAGQAEGIAAPFSAAHDMETADMDAADL